MPGIQCNYCLLAIQSFICSYFCIIDKNCLMKSVVIPKIKKYWYESSIEYYFELRRYFSASVSYCERLTINITPICLSHIQKTHNFPLYIAYWFSCVTKPEIVRVLEIHLITSITESRLCTRIHYSSQPVYE